MDYNLHTIRGYTVTQRKEIDVELSRIRPKAALVLKYHKSIDYNIVNIIR